MSDTVRQSTYVDIRLEAETSRVSSRMSDRVLNVYDCQLKKYNLEEERGRGRGAVLLLGGKGRKE